jgi:hypothetical protein
MNHIKLIRNILPGVIILLTLGANGQAVHLTTGSKMVMNGTVKLVLNNSGFVNDGSFTAGNSSVLLTGNAAVAGIGGTNASSFNNMSINKSSGIVQLNNDISVSSIITMLNGNLELNNHSLNLGNSGSIAGESDQSHITGVNGGSVFVTGKQIPGNPFNPGNIGAELLTNDNLGPLTIERRHVSETLPDGVQSIDRSFDIFGSKLPVFFDVRLRFFYLDTELDGNDENGLMLWTRSGAGNFLIPLGRDSNDATGNRVIKNGLDQLSHFTLASDGGGPAIRDIENVRNRPVTNSFTETSATIYPNPAHDKFVISVFSKEAKEMAIRLYDQSGRLLQQKEIYCLAGMNTIAWNLSGYAAGIYYLSFKNQQQKNIKIIKE